MLNPPPSLQAPHPLSILPSMKLNQQLGVPPQIICLALGLPLHVVHELEVVGPKHARQDQIHLHVCEAILVAD